MGATRVDVFSNVRWILSDCVPHVSEVVLLAAILRVEPDICNSGLGIGTCPSALIAHGVKTTVVELDPAVHYLATKYFDLAKNHTAVIEDAITFVDKAASVNAASYDYIVHDVFTGGAEPAALFTFEFLSGLKQLLAENGVVAIVSVRSACLSHRTILSAQSFALSMFSSSLHCLPAR